MRSRNSPPGHERLHIEGPEEAPGPTGADPLREPGRRSARRRGRRGTRARSPCAPAGLPSGASDPPSNSSAGPVVGRPSRSSRIPSGTAAPPQAAIRTSCIEATVVAMSRTTGVRSAEGVGEGVVAEHRRRPACGATSGTKLVQTKPMRPASSREPRVRSGDHELPVPEGGDGHPLTLSGALDAPTASPMSARPVRTRGPHRAGAHRPSRAGRARVVGGSMSWSR